MTTRYVSYNRYALYSHTSNKIICYRMLTTVKKNVLNDAFKAQRSPLQYVSCAMAHSLIALHKNEASLNFGSNS